MELSYAMMASFVEFSSVRTSSFNSLYSSSDLDFSSLGLGFLYMKHTKKMMLPLRRGG